MQNHKLIQTRLTAARGTTARIRRLLLRRIWLPRFVYEALPWIYIACGSIALLAALYRRHWTWIVPLALCAGLIGIHAGLALFELRRHYRQRRRDRR